MLVNDLHHMVQICVFSLCSLIHVWLIDVASNSIMV